VAAKDSPVDALRSLRGYECVWPVVIEDFMAKIVVSAEGTVDAPADTVYGYIADTREHHPRFLPPAFTDFRVESGGVGAGTVTRFKLTAGGRTREYRTVVAEPEPGRILTETDTNSSAITTFTISPQGAASLVRISTSWDGSGGIGGLFERTFAPRVLRAIYADELKRLDGYAREHRST
jgi:Polyketide cyclase / dehydrase and lipid transport